MGVGDAARYAESESGAGLVVAESIVGFENLVQLVGGQARSLVDEVEDHHLGFELLLDVIHDDDPHPITIFNRVVSQVADAPFQRQRFTAIGFLAPAFDQHLLVTTQVVTFGNLLQ